MARRKTWSPAAKARVKSYYSYKRKEKSFAEKYNIRSKPVSYKDFSIVYQNRVKEVLEGKRAKVGDVGSYIIKKENRPVALYEEYKEELYRRSEAMIKKGLDPYDGIEKSFSEFIQRYNEYEYDLKKEVSEGKRKSVGDIIGRIVSDQVYEISSRQYEAVYNAIIEWNAAHPENAIDLGTGNKLSLQMKIRQGEFLEDEGWWEIVRARKKEFISKGFSNKEANKKIRQELFGSP